MSISVQGHSHRKWSILSAQFMSLHFATTGKSLSRGPRIFSGWERYKQLRLMPGFLAQPVKRLSVSLRCDKKILVWCQVGSAHFVGELLDEGIEFGEILKVFLKSVSSYRKHKSFLPSLLTGHPICVWMSSLAGSHESNSWKWNICPVCTLCLSQL